MEKKLEIEKNEVEEDKEVSRQVKVFKVTIRKSPVTFLINFVVINLFLLGLYLLFFAINSALSLGIISNNLSKVNLLMIALVVIYEMYIVVSHILKWINHSYSITHDSIIENRGVFFKKQNTCVFRNILEVKLRQRLLGKIFKYGTIEIKTQLQDEQIILKNVMNPVRNVKLIWQIATKNQEPIAIVDT